MSEYISDIDYNAIRLGDLANELGDYKCALENYSKALNRLRNYQGDKTAPNMMASGLAEKINELSNKIKQGHSVLNFDTWTLTKSSFVKGKQCVKYLFLDKYKKQEKKPISQEKQLLFNQGHSFEDSFRNNEFPDGVNIKEVVGNFAYFNSYTKHLLNISDKTTLYEATIIEDKVLVMCDVLIKNDEGLVDIYEVKLNTKINDTIFNDLSIQYFVCKKRFGNNLKSFNLVLRTENSEQKWKVIDLTTDLEKQIEVVENKVEEYKQVLNKNEPNIKMGEHCNKPYECEFIEYCKLKC
jgi:hypothetical protein